MQNETNKRTKLVRDVATLARSLLSVKVDRLYRSTAMLILCLPVSLFAASPAYAQLFGARSVGSPISSPSAQGGSLNSNAAGSPAGILNGNERFVCGNRSRRDFVGSDRNEQSGFVGAAQAIGVGRVQSATDGLRIQAVDSARINRPIPAQSTKGIYYPRLEIGFDASQLTTISISELAADERTLARVVNVTGNTAHLTLSGRTAILRGTVKTARDAELAEQLLSFEPGIDRVQNELRIAK